MKNIRTRIFLVLLIFTMCIVKAQENILTITVDGSRLIDNKNKFDHGLDLITTLYFDRDTNYEKFIRLEWFKNINYIKLGIGIQKKIHVTPKIDIATGVEGSLIYREKPSKWAWCSFLSYAINSDVKYNLGTDMYLIASYNYQRRTDFNMYGEGEKEKVKFVGTSSFGLGYRF